MDASAKRCFKKLHFNADKKTYVYTLLQTLAFISGRKNEIDSDDFFALEKRLMISLVCLVLFDVGRNTYAVVKRDDSTAKCIGTTSKFVENSTQT